MNFNDEINELLEVPISTVERYSCVIAEIEAKMKKSLQDNVLAENMTSFYRGDIMGSELKPKIFNTNHFEFEAKNFKIQYKQRKKECESELHFLCRSQHEYENIYTRLLDFSKNALVALRFACGREDENEDKKVTIFFTNVMREKDFEEDSKVFMKLVKSDNLKGFTQKEKEHISKDHFIYLPEMLDDIERCKRQEGAFLFPGNLKYIDTPHNKNKKVAHKLSTTTGRGEKYPGYIVNIPIKKNM